MQNNHKEKKMQQCNEHIKHYSDENSQTQQKKKNTPPKQNKSPETQPWVIY